MIENDQPKRALQEEEDDDEVLDIINNSAKPLKKLKETRVETPGEEEDVDEVMNIIDSSLNNKTESNGNASRAADLNDTNNNVASDEKPDEEDNDEVMDIIESSMNKGGSDSTEAKGEQETDKPVNDDQSDELVDESAFKLEKLVPKAAIHQVETEDGCLHEVVTPIDVEYKPLRNFYKMEHFKPAKEYPFVVDPFQREAILCIENNQSVLGELWSS